jgi:hypothetical protein
VANETLFVLKRGIRGSQRKVGFVYLRGRPGEPLIHAGPARGAIFSENVFLSVKWIRGQFGLGSLGGFFRVSQRERSLKARLLVQIVNQAGKCGMSLASQCHPEMSSRNVPPLYHRGYKRDSD